MLAVVHMGEPTLDVLARLAGRVARWQEVDIFGPFGPYRADARASVQQVREGGDVTREAGPSSTRAKSPL
jgi:hypothetical protein